jgi:phosphoserine phosphatase RsbU/P
MFLLFVTGALLGVFLLLWPFHLARQKTKRLDESRMQIAQDRQRVSDSTQLLEEAIGEGLIRQELQQRIVEAAILCSGALSACLFVRNGNNTLRGVAVAGLFPPHRPLTGSAHGNRMTRAKLMEEVFKTEELPLGEGIASAVAQSGKGELLADAAADPRVLKHDDPSLLVRSLIAVPLLFRERSFGVLVVTNPGGDQPFTEMDFSLMQSFAGQAALALHNAEVSRVQLEKK